MIGLNKYIVAALALLVPGCATTIINVNKGDAGSAGHQKKLASEVNAKITGISHKDEGTVKNMKTTGDTNQ